MKNYDQCILGVCRPVPHRLLLAQFDLRSYKVQNTAEGVHELA